ncbi:Macrophage erythroblast attacher [Echinococcus granulosus]|uniref:Erythroblast macrophage protein EMP n=1 Tax=Echinococcus granulosus TaxID=6210 RepID=U6JCX0_ECHGR|nr:Macrophage erythroblast attacher [Echinococcus granulosus]EUB64150.1 Macrophage erythroblast attacher [Echinococcus granulosus]CDS21865.1 erythroblast macrophage protein EMP [Echinococcus granulosus]
MASAASCSEIELTEYMGMKAVYELLNKKYRVNHRELEKNSANLNRIIDKFGDVNTSEEAAEFIGRVITAVRGSKRKADEIFNEEMELVASCKRRIDNLKEASDFEGKFSSNLRGLDNTLLATDQVESFIAEPGNKSSCHTKVTASPQAHSEQRIFASRCNRLLAEHLFAVGHYSSALALARQCPDADKIFIDIFQEALTIQEALSRGDTEPAHKWFQEAKFRLKHAECTFDFDLRVFEFYLLVKANKRLEAVQHSRKYLGNFQQDDDYKTRRLGQAMLLLIMRTSEEVDAKAAQNELNEAWIIKRFHLALMNFYSFTSPTPFSLAVRAGITAIKTHFCYNSKSRHPDCVVCHPLINRFAQNLLFGRHDHSVLTCYQTGLVMNDDNPPMALPNGYVYSQQGIADLTGPDGKLTCPRSGETFDASEAKRVYIL